MPHSLKSKFLSEKECREREANIRRRAGKNLHHRGYGSFLHELDLLHTIKRLRKELAKYRANIRQPEKK